jgi:hypothetical protein
MLEPDTKEEMVFVKQNKTKKPGVCPVVRTGIVLELLFC